MKSKILKCKCGADYPHCGLSGPPCFTDYFVFCTVCGQGTEEHEHAYQAINEWNAEQMK